MKIYNLKNTPALKSTLGEFTRNHMTPQSANIFLKRIWMCSKHPNSVCACSYKNKWYSSFVYRHPVFCIPSFYLSWYRKCVVMIFQLLVIPLPWLITYSSVLIFLMKPAIHSSPKPMIYQLIFPSHSFSIEALKKIKFNTPKVKKKAKKMFLGRSFKCWIFNTFTFLRGSWFCVIARFIIIIMTLSSRFMLI